MSLSLDDDGAPDHLLEGRPISIGPDWKATYSQAGVEFTPARGQRAPHTHTLSFELLEVRRGIQALEELTLGVEPHLRSGAVVYDRGPGLVERYDARPEGLEQSFVLHTLPTGSGDLVVRGRLRTDLPAERRLGPDALEFTDADWGGVRIDTVLGIDADGQRVAGQLRRSRDELELVLPAAFVDNARLPLVLDPLFGPLLQLDHGAVDRDQIDVASAGAPHRPVRLRALPLLLRHRPQHHALRRQRLRSHAVGHRDHDQHI